MDETNIPCPVQGQGFKLGDNYYYPFYERKFEFTRSLYLEIERLNKPERIIISEINKDWRNILKYNPEVLPYDGEVEEGTIKSNYFYIGFDYFALCCYIDIEDFESKSCIALEIVHYDVKRVLSN